MFTDQPIFSGKGKGIGWEKKTAGRPPRATRSPSLMNSAAKEARDEERAAYRITPLMVHDHVESAPVWVELGLDCGVLWHVKLVELDAAGDRQPSPVGATLANLDGQDARLPQWHLVRAGFAEVSNRLRGGGLSGSGRCWQERAEVHGLHLAPLRVVRGVWGICNRLATAGCPSSFWDTQTSLTLSVVFVRTSS